MPAVASPTGCRGGECDQWHGQSRPEGPRQGGSDRNYCSGGGIRSKPGGGCLNFAKKRPPGQSGRTYAMAEESYGRLNVIPSAREATFLGDAGLKTSAPGKVKRSCGSRLGRIRKRAAPCAGSGPCLRHCIPRRRRGRRDRRGVSPRRLGSCPPGLPDRRW